MRCIVRVWACVAVVALGWTAGADAAAHEQREIGPAALVVGWAEEPAFAGSPNAVEVRVSRGGDPVEGLDDLEVRVRYGDETLGPLRLDAVFDAPGEYRADLVPTVPGAYSFQITGTIDGRVIDETFDPGPETFDEVQSSDDIEFPQQAPSNVELAQAVEQINARGDEANAGSSGQTLAVLALALAGIALVVSVVGSVRRG